VLQAMATIGTLLEDREVSYGVLWREGVNREDSLLPRDERIILRSRKDKGDF
jgi:hypothetical protein